MYMSCKVMFVYSCVFVCLFFFVAQIRGLQIEEAIKQMTFSPKRPAEIIKQVGIT